MQSNYQIAAFSSMESSENEQYNESVDFEVSDFFSNFDEWGLGENEQNPSFGYQGNELYDQLGGSSNHQNEEQSSREIMTVWEKKDVKGRIAFRMKSEIDVLEDGYKWRKYGKKMVKNSPNPRNYYRCSANSCVVKKRVERDNEDPNYVITTYEGIHNHVAPR